LILRKEKFEDLEDKNFGGSAVVRPPPFNFVNVPGKVNRNCCATRAIISRGCTDVLKYDRLEIELIKSVFNKMSRLLGAHADEETMSIMPLGGGQEVGRSSILLQFRGRNILLDCGTHPGREGIDSLPFFDSLDDPSSIDLILVTHFHIDHCAALPYFTEKTNFRGRIFMTHATKAVMRMLLSDNIKLQTRTRPLYSEQVHQRFNQDESVTQECGFT
jgi:predicted metal-dependent RNase